MFYELAFEHSETGEIVGIDINLNCDYEVMTIHSTNTHADFYNDLVEFWQEQSISDDDVVLFMELYGYDYVAHMEQDYDYQD